jgi:heptosyltransferase-2
MAEASLDRMKWIDHYAGIPLCWALGGAAVLLRMVRGTRRVPEDPRRILIMKFLGMGHVLLASPLLRALRQRFPRAQLVFLTFDSTAPVVRRQGLVDEVREIRTTSAPAFVLDVVRQIGRLQAERVDVTIDLEFFSKFSTMMSVLSGASARVGYYLETFWRDSIITHPVFFNYHRHVLDIYEAAIHTLGVPMPDRSIAPLSTSADERGAAARFLAAHGIDAGVAVIGVNPNASDLSLERRWPLESFVALLDRLLARQECAVLLTGGAGEREYVRRMEQALRPRWGTRIVNACGELTFAQFVAALSHCRLFLTGDSGPMHVAVAQGVPTVSLWGPTNPNFHAPVAAHHWVVHRRLPCSPCVPMLTSRPGMWCHHRADCMQQLSVDEVLDVVHQALATVARDGGSPRHGVSLSA